MFYIKTDEDIYVKRTSTARAFGGVLRLTGDQSDAKRFTRRGDANMHMRMVNHRLSEDHWSQDFRKFGPAVFAVQELI